jgi:polar amino acid transport system substrate-binding protein/cystine transport system substrate-binding protein/membrane-bound lytic murein transglycosylase F
MDRLARIGRDLFPIAIVLGLLAAVYLLPPDRSLAEIREQGALRICVPPAYPPLVTGDAGAPGIDVELLRAIAADIGVSAAFNQNIAMGRDFNPRGWRLTRAQCQVIAGGVVDSPTTRSFLDVTSPYAETGWAAVTTGPFAPLAGHKVAVFVGVSGLDRLGLSAYLRRAKVKATIVTSLDDLTAGLAAGDFDAALTERLLAAWIAGRHDWQATPLTELEQYPVAFGLWKGDLTLKRAIGASLARLSRSGQTQAILERYLGKATAAAAPLS